MIAIPTTAGTGSEVGRSGVVTIEATNAKTVIFAPSLLPDVAILDPAMTATMPPFMTAATGMDALAHCIEAYSAIGDHPMADAIALGGVRLCRRSGPTVVARRLADVVGHCPGRRRGQGQHGRGHEENTGRRWRGPCRLHSFTHSGFLTGTPNPTAPATAVDCGASSV